MKAVFIFAAVALSACAADEYHSIGQPDLPLRQANASCGYRAFQDHPDNSWAGVGVAFGAVGGAVAGATSLGADRMEAIQAEWDGCLASHGWMKN